jgi:hypothetical protein
MDQRHAGSMGAASRVPFRLTTRRWMVVMALIGMTLAAWTEIERRRSRFQRLARAHLDSVIGLGVGFGPPSGLGLIGIGPDGRPLTEREKELDLWHLRLHLKYAEASRYPWKSVPPDLPKSK